MAAIFATSVCQPYLNSEKIWIFLDFFLVKNFPVLLIKCFQLGFISNLILSITVDSGQ